MTRALWKLQSHLARLKIDRLTANLDLRRPDTGLFGLSPGEDRSCDAHLLAVQFPPLRYPPSSEGHEFAPTECFARHTDLLASYLASTTWPVRVDALWRAPSAAPSEGFATAIELVVSVQTERLASRPELVVHSRIATGEVLHLIDADSATCQALEPSKGDPIDLRPDGGAGCLLFRLQGDELTYVEMIHPADFRSDQLDRDPEDGRFVRIGHHLFHEPLEKGVIRRARIRGIFLPRKDDERLAAACHASWAASEPLIAT